MGSWASGNHYRERRKTTDEMPRINVGDIATMPLLPEFWQSPPSTEINCLRVCGRDNLVIFGIATTSKVIEIGAAGLTYSARNFGGQQVYFHCECGKRVGSLYLDCYSIACRLCHGLLYESQFSYKHEQSAIKAAKLRAKLGGGPALLQPLPEKPKHMHRETYERITYQILTYELAAAEKLERYKEERWIPVLLKLDQLEAQYQS